jgi:uncharacterized spore protein YtfJ
VEFPFAGGSGAGVSINPVAFMVVGNGQIKLLPVNINSSLDKVLDMVPDFLKKVEDTIKKRGEYRKEARRSENGGKAENSREKSTKEAEIIFTEDKRNKEDLDLE